VALSTDVTGSGSFTDGVIALAGQSGPPGAAGAAGSVSLGKKTFTTTAYLGGPGSSGSYTTNDLGKAVIFQGSADTVLNIDTPANLGANFFASISHAGSGGFVTLTPASGTIDGATSKRVAKGDVYLLQGDGSTLVTR
jgi:hypothetical protein